MFVPTFTCSTYIQITSVCTVFNQYIFSVRAKCSGNLQGQGLLLDQVEQKYRHVDDSVDITLTSAIVRTVDEENNAHGREEFKSDQNNAGVTWEE